ncbi:hypothetical protein [Lysobacter solisilvae (ex Woo and Kim 2020)]|uniref:Integral membrane protein n=1 Tax=Agrilutibacter terrestris TaxID=2865112 RepID=A0A7H0FVN2_9GAMM|nr:hypothetical protein [Lysobacter terrestris]QNP40098.1 hypothetical protein H8B22_11420 [Lysobacter terrestris]
MLPPMSRTGRLPLLLAHALLVPVLLGIAGCSRKPAPQDEARGGSLSGVLLDSQLAEISGLAASRRHRNALWLLDDGGNPARLFAVNDKGDRLATLRIEGVTKTDWEDLAAFRLDGRDYLLIADTGDNGGLRRTLQLHAIEEPAQLQNARIKPAWSIAFRWPDGARDCEAVAVDERAGQVLLISKKRLPPELFVLPLRPQRGVQTARLVGRLAGVPQPDAAQLRANPKQARILNQVTGADVSPDDRTLAVLTYRNLLLYPRRSGQSWAAAVATPPRLIELPWIPQAEALGWTSNGKALYATGEFIPAPLYRIEP